MSTSLPERPDLGQPRRQAKELRDAARREEAGAIERFVRHHSALPGKPMERGRRPPNASIRSSLSRRKRLSRSAATPTAKALLPKPLLMGGLRSELFVEIVEDPQHPRLRALEVGGTPQFLAGAITL